MKNTLILALALAFGATAVDAQQRIDERISTGSTGEVRISNLAGRVNVTGWDRNEIRITGTLGEGAERVEVSGSRDRTRIGVIIPRGTRNVRGTTLEIRVPHGKDVNVTTTSADIRVEGVSGGLELRSTSGDVTARGASRQVVAGSTSGDVVVDAANAVRVQVSSTSGDVRLVGSVRESVSAESVSGDVEVRATTPEVRAKSVSGDLLLQGVSGRVSASTTSGETRIRDSRIQYGSFETVSGDFLYEGDLARGAALNIQSHSGSIEMRLPASVAAEFEARTFSGRITSHLGGTVEPTRERGRGQELRFTAGSGGGMVSLMTFSGSVKLLRR